MNLHSFSVALLVGDVIKVFNPQSPQARAIFDLTIVVIFVMVIIFAVVVGIVTYAWVRFPRWREGERDPDQASGNNTIEIVWTVIPLAIVTILFVLSARTMGISDPPPPPKPDIVDSYSSGQTGRAKIGCRGCPSRVLGTGAGAETYNRAGSSESPLDSGGEACDVSRFLHGILRNTTRLDALSAGRRTGGRISEVGTGATSPRSSTVD
jgi:hypothetical protein